MKEMRYILMVLMLALIGVQANAVEYPVYQPSGRQVAGPAFTPATAPNSTFQSTSTMSAGSGSSTFCSTLNADGTVNAGAYGIGKNNALGRQRRVDSNNDDDDEEEGEETGNAGTPGQTVDPKDQLPLGDAVLPLMLLACAYMCLRTFLKRKRACNG
jgi:hypothetical protein